MLSDNVKDILGYEGLYAVTDDGKIYSHSRVVKASHGSTQLRKGRWLKPELTKAGYQMVSLSRDSKVKKYLVHRLVASAFIDKNKDKIHVNHIDGNKSNNHASNLEWCTPSENISHGYDSGLIKKGEKASWSKLTESDVIKIRNSTGLSQRELGEMYGVSQAAIYFILKEKCWRGVNGRSVT